MLRRVALVLSMLGVATAFADSPMRVDRETFLRQLRAEIDSADLILPIPDPECGKPGSLRVCSAKVSPTITMDLTSTFDFREGDPESRRRPAIDAFLAGAPGKLYEVRFTVDGMSDRSTLSRFDALCISAARVLQGISRTRATSIYNAAFRRAANSLGASDTGKSGAVSRAVRFSVEMARGSTLVACRLSSVDADRS